MTWKFMSGGAWREAVDLKFMSGGAWQRAQEAKMMIGGAWRSVFVYDITGPGVPTGITAEWSNTSGPRCTVSWTQPTATDFSYTDLYVNRNGATNSWTYIGRYTGTGVKTYVDSTVTLSSDSSVGPNQKSPIHYYRFVTADDKGNTTPTNPATIITSGVGQNVFGSSGQNSALVRGYWASPYYVNTTYSRTWRNGVWRSDTTVDDGVGNPTRAIQGTTTNPTNYGFYFYENAPVQGLNCTSLTVRLGRVDGGFGQAKSPYIYATTAPRSYVTNNTSPIGVGTSSLTLGTALYTPSNGGTPTDSTHSIPTSWYSSFASGTYQSIMVFTGEATVASGTSSNYAVFKGYTEDAGFGLPFGYLTVVHTG